MKNHNLDKNSEQKFFVKTKQGEVEITWSRNQQPGFCPNCHKCIPFNSIVFKKENGDYMENYSGTDAVKAKKFGISKDSIEKNASKICECPYCHQTIPVREVILKMKGDQER